MLVPESTTTVFAVVDPTSMPNHKEDDAVIWQNIHEKRRLDKDSKSSNQSLGIRTISTLANSVPRSLPFIDLRKTINTNLANRACRVLMFGIMRERLA
ncbi:MAG: hypothetical protein LBH85_01790 [Treponema sp.]|nr:hypothetical protein [Treponema sp.]